MQGRQNKATLCYTVQPCGGGEGGGEGKKKERQGEKKEEERGKKKRKESQRPLQMMSNTKENKGIKEEGAPISLEAERQVDL